MVWEAYCSQLMLISCHSALTWCLVQLFSACCSTVYSGTAAGTGLQYQCTGVPCSPTSGMASGFATLMDEESSSDEEGEVLPGKVALAGA